MNDHPFLFNAAWRQLKNGLCQLARQEILPRFHQVRVQRKEDGSPVTEADQMMQQAVQNFLYELWPEAVFLGEESLLKEQQTALGSDAPCWILDPLDGTTNFSCGFQCFAVSLGLLVQGQPVLGLVYDPIKNELFSARSGQGAYLNESPLYLRSPKTKLREALALVDFKRLPARLAVDLALNAPYASQRNLGSVALDWCWLAAGRGDLYLHGGQKLWDHAAAHLIFAEAGGHSCTFDDQAIFSFELQPRSAIAANNPILFQAWRQYVQQRL